MKVAYDASRLNGPRTGIHRYLSLLLGSASSRRFEWVPLERPAAMRRFQWLLHELPRRAGSAGADALFIPHFWDFPGPVTMPVVSVVLDVWPLEHPSRLDPHYWRHRFFRPLTGADGIICISEFTRKRMERAVPGLSCPVEVIHLAAAASLDRTGAGDLPDRVPPRFFLAVLSQDPRKNISFLESILSRLPLPLVIAGTVDDNRLVRAVKLGSVTDDELVALYRKAEGLLIPSTYEGFGLPALEAARLSCPILAADTSSLSEILAGYPGLLPLDPERWIASATALTDSPQERERFTSAGLALGDRFRPELIIERTERFIEKILTRR